MCNKFSPIGFKWSEIGPYNNSDYKSNIIGISYTCFICVYILFAFIFKLLDDYNIDSKYFRNIYMYALFVIVWMIVSLCTFDYLN